MAVNVADDKAMSVSLTPEDLAESSFDRLSREDQQILMESEFPGVTEVFDRSNPEKRRYAARRLFRWYFGQQPPTAGSQQG